MHSHESKNICNLFFSSRDWHEIYMGGQSTSVYNTRLFAFAFEDRERNVW